MHDYMRNVEFVRKSEMPGTAVDDKKRINLRVRSEQKAILLPAPPHPNSKSASKTIAHRRHCEAAFRRSNSGSGTSARGCPLDCFVASAPRNGGSELIDVPAIEWKVAISVNFLNRVRQIRCLAA
jgi:hypothetical protein